MQHLTHDTPVSAPLISSLAFDGTLWAIITSPTLAMGLVGLMVVGRHRSVENPVVMRCTSPAPQPYFCSVRRGWQMASREAHFSRNVYLVNCLRRSTLAFAGVCKFDLQKVLGRYRSVKTPRYTQMHSRLLGFACRTDSDATAVSETQAIQLEHTITFCGTALPGWEGNWSTAVQLYKLSNHDGVVKYEFLR